MVPPLRGVTEPRPAATVETDDEGLLSELFLRRRPTYGEADVLRLARISPAALQRAVDEGEIEPEENGAERVFAWEDVATLALGRWTPRRISAAVGAALPLLNRTHTITVQLPLYQIRFLHWLAQASTESGKPAPNLSDVLEREIDGIVSSIPDSDFASLEQRIPGFAAAALAFPSFEQRPWLVEAGACVYCGSPTYAGCHACPSCMELHEPATGGRS